MRLLPACSPLPSGRVGSARGACRVVLGRAVWAGCGAGQGRGASGTRPRARKRFCASGAAWVPAFLPLRLAFYLSLALGLPPPSVPALTLFLWVAECLYHCRSWPLALSLTVLSHPLHHCPPAVALWDVVLSLEAAVCEGCTCEWAVTAVGHQDASDLFWEEKPGWTRP